MYTWSRHATCFFLCFLFKLLFGCKATLVDRDLELESNDTHNASDSKMYKK